MVDPACGALGILLSFGAAIRTPGPEHPKLQRPSTRYSVAPSSLLSQQPLSPSAASDIDVGEDLEPVPLHDALVAKLGGGELAFRNQALNRLGLNVQNLGGLDDVDIILKHGSCLYTVQL